MKHLLQVWQHDRVEEIRGDYSTSGSSVSMIVVYSACDSSIQQWLYLADCSHKRWTMLKNEGEIMA